MLKLCSIIPMHLARVLYLLLLPQHSESCGLARLSKTACCKLHKPVSNALRHQSRGLLRKVIDDWAACLAGPGSNCSRARFRMISATVLVPVPCAPHQVMPRGLCQARLGTNICWQGVVGYSDVALRSPLDSGRTLGLQHSRGCRAAIEAALGSWIIRVHTLGQLRDLAPGNAHLVECNNVRLQPHSLGSRPMPPESTRVVDVAHLPWVSSRIVHSSR